MKASSFVIASGRPSADFNARHVLGERPIESQFSVLDVRGDRYFAIYNPPVVNRQLGIRKSALGSARDIAARFLEKGLQTIVFAPSRRLCNGC
jgi:hypothetical protein